MKTRKAILIVLSAIAVSGWVLPETAVAKLHGRYKSMGWQDEWSQATLMFLESEGQDLIKATQRGFQDQGEFCGKSLKDRKDAKLFLLAMFKTLAQPESNYRTALAGRFKCYKNDKRFCRHPMGLLQMDYISAAQHGCTTVDGKKYQGTPVVSRKMARQRGYPSKSIGGAVPGTYRHSRNSPLTNAFNNIKCAIRIANNGAKKSKHQNTIASGSKGHIGVFGWFWQPMRKGWGGNGVTTGATVNNQKNREYIKRTVSATCGNAYSEPKGFLSNFSTKEKKLADSTHAITAPTTVATTAETTDTNSTLQSSPFWSQILQQLLQVWMLNRSITHAPITMPPPTQSFNYVPNYTPTFGQAINERNNPRGPIITLGSNPFLRNRK